MTVKSLATGMAALAAIGAAAAGVTCIASVTAVSPNVQPVVFGVPLPLDPVAPVGVDLPTADQLATVLNTLQDPSVSFANKGDLVEGGIPVSGRPCRPRTAEGRYQGQPAADVQHHQHRARRPRRRDGHDHRVRSAPRPDAGVPPVRRSGRLEAVTRLGDDADFGRAFALTAAEWAGA